jgi:hypothetical protein
MRSKKKIARPKKAAQVFPWWQVVRFKSTPAAQIGRVQASDRETAIRKAIEMYGITDAVRQARLSANRVS